MAVKAAVCRTRFIKYGEQLFGYSYVFLAPERTCTYANREHPVTSVSKFAFLIKVYHWPCVPAHVCVWVLETPRG